VTEIGEMDRSDRAFGGIESGSVLEGAYTASFEAACILTRDAGFVIAMPDGSEYQVTVVRSR
jgi:hypothetical protein